TAMQSDLSQHATERFTGLAAVYARSRPDYPVAILDFLATNRLAPGAAIVDVGSGTGISSRWLASRGWSVVGVEPNEEMRREAEAQGGPRVGYQAGTGEQTGLPDGCADAVVCCQAFHWFEPTAALGEFERILKSGGWVCLIWNERDPADPFTADF